MSCNKCISISYRILAILKLLPLMPKNDIRLSKNTMIAGSADINLSSKGKLSIGRNFALLKDAQLTIRDNGHLSIGNDVSIGIRSFINCHDCISIGDNVEIAQDVKIYDHDHDIKNYSLDGVEWRRNFITKPVVIGSNVWIGANTIILKGTVIEDNCVIAAGSVIPGGVVEKGTVFIQKKVK